MNRLKLLALKLHSVAVFRNLLDDSVIKSLSALLDSTDSDNVSEQIDNYGKFVSELYSHTDNLSRYLLNIVTDDENVFIKKVAAGQIISDELTECVKEELSVFGELASLSREDLRNSINYHGYLPEWKTENIDFENEYFRRRDEIGRFGYGIYAKYHMFCIKDGQIIPIKHPDPVTLADLSGYQNERNAVINNTKALIDGKPAANILLSGDAGTGKSSTVKAVANEFRSQGLRIIEVRKEQIVEIPTIIDELSANPLKFILFIDDLSFNQADDNFSTLKAILEGSVAAKSGNVAIYATSNRRHIVRESFKDRDSSDDVHRNDTVQELMSLSERFGLMITFVKPGKECYLEIMKNIALQHNIEINEQLCMEAERFALVKGGRSARTAKQFVDSILSR